MFLFLLTRFYDMLSRIIYKQHNVWKFHYRIVTNLHSGWNSFCYRCLCCSYKRCTLFAIIVLFQINLSNNTCANIPNTVCPLYINHRIFIFCKNLFTQILIHRSLNIFKLLLMIFLFQIYFRQNHIESRGTITGKFLYLFPIFWLTGKLVTGNNGPLLHIYFFSRQ